MVCLEPDKAVYPVNASGMTKALREKPAQAFARHHPKSKTIVSITRYGNVMYSRGSVIPLFVQQIQSGRSLTLTEPKMTRFLMTLQESVDLVEHAFLNAEPGDLFVRKAPACTVEVLATAVANLLGNQDPEIKLIGTRHGEKLHETLLSREEMHKASEEADYFKVPLDARSLEYELFNEQGEMDAAKVDDYTSANTRQLDINQTKELLLMIHEMRELLERGTA